jgi:hypothetical protein
MLRMNTNRTATHSKHLLIVFLTAEQAKITST